MKKPVLLASVLFFMLIALWSVNPENVWAQGVSVNRTGAAPDTSAILDISSSTAPFQGMLIPRMTTAQRNQIYAPANGLVIYNLDCNEIQYFNGSSWMSLLNSTNFTMPGSISGSLGFCPGQTGVVYSVSPVNGAISYNWTVPVGATITAGQGTTSITVDFGSNSGSVSVSASSLCSVIAMTSLNVTAGSAPPVPGAITGTTGIYNGQTGVAYSITAVSGATTYTWTVPTGATIVSGQGTTAIIVDFGSNAGNVCVTSGNSCGNSTASCLAVNVTSCYTPGTQTFSYTGSVVNWTVPCGVTSVTIEAWGAQGGGIIGGLGARMKGTFAVSAGNVLGIAVGGQGTANACGGAPGTGGGGGGGGSFVWLTTNTTLPMIAAGGGGGGCENWGNTCADGLGGSIGTSGVAGNGGVSLGGVNGNGGAGNAPSGTGSGGGGWLTAGQNSTYGDGCTGGQAAFTFTGGAGAVNRGPGGDGGFGGGGGAVCGAGGGGGYSGGGGGQGATCRAGGGGGGSFNAGTAQSNTDAVQTGNGQVIVTW
ncbi:MAG: hypothetical protein WCM76_16330 [Bacteroidota bacterium]